MILLDTTVVSELMRPAPDPRVRAWLVGLGSAPIVTSAVTIAEVVFGLARLPDGRRRAELSDRFHALIADAPSVPVLSLDEQAARHAGEFRAIRARAGLASSPTDMMIAGIAMANGARLATRNVADFSGLPISVENPGD